MTKTSIHELTSNTYTNTSTNYLSSASLVSVFSVGQSPDLHLPYLLLLPALARGAWAKKGKKECYYTYLDLKSGEGIQFYYTYWLEKTRNKEFSIILTDLRRQEGMRKSTILTGLKRGTGAYIDRLEKRGRNTTTILTGLKRGPGIQQLYLQAWKGRNASLLTGKDRQEFYYTYWLEKTGSWKDGYWLRQTVRDRDKLEESAIFLFTNRHAHLQTRGQEGRQVLESLYNQYHN